MTTKKELKFPEFEDIKVSTKTFTAMTNLKIEIKELYEKLPVTPYVVVVKKRGRKKKCEQINPNENIVEGSIVTLKCEGELRGVELKTKKSKNKNKKNKWFRNSITVVIILDKPVNFKICRNGTFQMTGCKTHEHAELCIKYIWQHIKDDKSLYSFTRNSDNISEPTLETLFIPSMRNIDFSLGFLVDREKLNVYMSPYSDSNYISKSTLHDKYFKDRDFHCLLETSFGYTGVNIKIPLTEDINTMEVKKMWYDSKNGWQEIWTNYREYLDLLPEKDRLSKLKDERYNTFLVFQSGCVIHSGLTARFMKDSYYYFADIMREGFDQIEERLNS
jgi:TATA-box binding protein (TBP) (component of TFIID and TFIIIB)